VFSCTPCCSLSNSTPRPATSAFGSTGQRRTGGVVGGPEGRREGGHGDESRGIDRGVRTGRPDAKRQSWRRCLVAARQSCSDGLSHCGWTFRPLIGQPAPFLGIRSGLSSKNKHVIFRPICYTRLESTADTRSPSATP
jgi:hypothetical protein